MLRAANVPAALETICGAGVRGALLMTIDGSLLGSAGEGMEGVADRGLGAIASSMWDDMAKADNGTAERLQVLLLDFEGGRMAITTATERHLVCAYGGLDVAPGDMRNKLLALRQSLELDLGRIDAR